MSTCTNWVTEVVTTCKNLSSQMIYQCTQWADEGSNQCQQWADEGSNQCQQWADEGSSQCTDWEECHWYTPWNCIAGFFCNAFYWVANWVCQGWYWVANWVCQAWYWLAKWVCIVGAWVLKVVCVAFSWVLELVCVAWDTVRCAIVAIINALGSLFGRGKGSQPKIEHVFVLALENRSFDHMFAFSGLRGTDAVTGAATQIDAANPATAFNIDPADGVTKIPVSAPADFHLTKDNKDPCHEFLSVLRQLAGPDAAWDPNNPVYPPINNSGFVYDYKNREACQADDPGGSNDPGKIMCCYDTANQLPVLNRLAQEFAICDNWHASLPGPTWPNRFFMMAASSGGLDDSPSKWATASSVTLDGYRFENGSIFDLMDEYCQDWMIFEGDEFPVSFALSGMNLNALQGRFKDFEDFESELNDFTFDKKFVFIEPKYGAHELDITGPGDFTCGNSMHPLDDVTSGEELIKKVYETIRNSPHWEKSLLIITWDEHGGFYDHVAPPPATPPGDTITQSYNSHNFQFDRLGVRVPAIIVSPLVQKGMIDHTLYDHTSILSSVEHLYGMHNLTNRDKNANDLLHLLSLSTPRTDAPTQLPDAAIDPDPLNCESDDQPTTSDRLLLARSQLRLSQAASRDGQDQGVSSSQAGFLQVALRKALLNTGYGERMQWLQQYDAIKTETDASIFILEAILKLKHGINFKQEAPPKPKSKHK